MKDTDFWFSLDRFKSLLPKSLDGKLNMLSLIVLLVTVILGLLKVQYFWLFGIVGLVGIIVYREYYKNQDEHDDYETSEIEAPDYEIIGRPDFYEGYPGEIMAYPCMNGGLAAGCNPNLETCDDLIYDPNPGINNTGETFDEIFGNVRDQVADSRFPRINQNGCRQEYFVG